MNRAPEQALEQGFEVLARLASDLGANALAVLVLEAAALEIAWCRRDAGEIPAAGNRITCGREICAALDDVQGPGSPAGRFLKSRVAPGANSFLIFPCRINGRGVAIVLGFEAREPGSIPSYVEDYVNLAAIATWSLKEVSRLHAELGTANQRFTGRKFVERAKLILQSERGMDEQQAYEYLRQMSRQRRITLSTLAENLIAQRARCT